MRLATIDLGTNTFLLLVADVTDRGLTPIYQASEIVRLGEQVDARKRLAESAMQRGLACLARFKEYAIAQGAEKIVLTGTSALRDAENADAFVAAVWKNLGLRVTIIPGHEEAAYSYAGAVSNKGHLPAPILMLDIGGGSTEYCLGDHQALKQNLSVDIGSVRLTEKYLRHDPVREEEIAAAREKIRSELKKKLSHWTMDFRTLLGVAGTVTTLAAMHFRVEPYDAQKIDGSILRQDHIHAQIEMLAPLRIEERKGLIGLEPGRADVILAGALILEQSVMFFGRDELVVSDRGLRYGIARNYFSLLKE